MGYILGLFLVLAILFSIAGGNNFGADILNKLKDKVSAFIFPKSEKEIMIENLTSDYNLLERFFSETANNILQSKDVSSEDKEIVKQAAETFKSSQGVLANLKKLEKEDAGLLKAVIKKAVDTVLKPKLSENPDPTHIPPQCKLICGE